MNKTRIFLLAGSARSGKDTIADIIQSYYETMGKKVVKLGFADYIKIYAEKISGWDGKEEDKPRSLLQNLGTDIVRNKINKNFFINRICEDIEVYSYYFDVIVISGARFPNELDVPKKKFANLYIIKVTRPNYVNNLTSSQKAHITEHALEEYSNYDYLIENNSTLDDLRKKTIKILDEVK